MNINTLKTGDLIVREKGPFSTHYIVWIGWRNGVELVAENHNCDGVRYTSLENALAGKPINRFEKFGGTEAQRLQVISEINKLLGRSYDLIVFNCEHFARWISSGKFESNQVRVASSLAVISGIAMLASNNEAARIFGVISIIAGVLGHSSQAERKM